MSSTAKVFRTDESNLSDLVALRFEWRSEERGERGLSLEEFDARFREWWILHRETHRGYLATIDEVGVGCAWLAIVDRVPGPANFIRRGGMIQSVYVSPAYRNRGVGSELVGELTSEARALGLEYLIVHPSDRSFPLYRRLGFAAAEKALELRFALS